MMASGADIHALNTVRRHLSRVKGGRLAAACVGTTVTLAISDVVGDDLHAIGSGPGVPDATTWSDAAAALDRFGGDAHSDRVRSVIRGGLAGALPDTPKPGHPSLARAMARVIGSRIDAMEGARAAALERGYHAIVMPEPVTGEARIAAPAVARRARAQLIGPSPGKVCVISSGETTVRVTGKGTGGRNLEFALSLADAMSSHAERRRGQHRHRRHRWLLRRRRRHCRFDDDDASGAGRALRRPGTYLAANDSFAFFAPLDDVVRLGRTDTNVGDLQVLLID